MSQSKSASLWEACGNTFLGFFISMLVWNFIAGPVANVPVDLWTNFVITSIFTVSSIIRNYTTRRVANWWEHRKLMKRIDKDFLQETFHKILRDKL